MNATAARFIRRARSHDARYVVLADFSEAHVGPRNGEPVANGSRNSAYDMATAGPRLV